ncbi:MAG: hypothetical protein M3024_10705 [Candidatus Dormibacteraeota bacterium]|nr:hypothetical protein [Candidatus Dormibacteraeota bacterium]
MDKLLFFGIGYVLGTRAGRERYRDLVGLARWVLARDEVQMAMGMARSAIETNLQRVVRPEIKRVA